ncbi:MAG: DUF971 domain-containing protein [Gammaproteobacteria bacterium]|nr:DUF971 domain-containing protein [Gammaproteobacteria bacterium]
MKSLTEIHLHKKSKVLALTFDDGSVYQLPCEYLRVFSPSAEVRGHSKDQRKLVAGKKNVSIINIEPVGSYAIKLIFDDGHSTGLYTWEILHSLSVQFDSNWQDYLLRLQTAKLSRE